MKTPLIISLLLLSFFASHASAENYGTPVQFINGLLSVSEAQCAKRGWLVREYERQGKAAEAYSTKNAEITICDCIPAQAKNVRDSLSKADRTSKISESAFTSKFMPQIVNKCTAEQLRSTYAEGCSERFSKIKLNSAKYCSCMSSHLTVMSDGEATQLGQESATYIPLAADAKKKGLPQPEQPPTFKRFMAKESLCSAE